MTRRGWVLFLAMGVIWGLPYLLIKVSVREVSPAFLVFVRTAGGAVLLAPFFVRRGTLRPLVPHWRPVVIYTVAELAIPWLMLFTAEEKVSSSLSGLLVAAVPIAGALLARATGTDRLDRRRLAGLGLGVVGAGALVGFDVGSSSALAASSFLLVITGYALGPWILARYLSGVANGSVILASLVLCALAYTPAAVIQRPRHSLSASVVLSMTGLTVVCTALAFTLFFALIKEVGPMRATVITYLNPAVAVLLGVTVLGESFGVAIAVGFVAVLGGSFLATRSLRPPVPAPSPPPGTRPEPPAPRPGPPGTRPEPSGTLPKPKRPAPRPGPSAMLPGLPAGSDVTGTTGQAPGATVSGAWERPPNLD